MLGTGELKYPGGPKLALLPGRLVLIYQGVEEENLDQNHLVLQVGGGCSGSAPRSSIKNKKC